MAQLMVDWWMKKYSAEVNAEYEESVVYSEQETKKINVKNEKRQKEIAELKDDYIAEIERNGKANRKTWYGRIEYLEGKIDLSKRYMDDVREYAVRIETKYNEMLVLMYRCSEMDREDKLEHERREERNRLEQERLENKRRTHEEEDRLEREERDGRDRMEKERLENRRIAQEKTEEEERRLKKERQLAQNKADKLGKEELGESQRGGGGEAPSVSEHMC